MRSTARLRCMLVQFMATCSYMIVLTQCPQRTQASLSSISVRQRSLAPPSAALADTSEKTQERKPQSCTPLPSWPQAASSSLTLLAVFVSPALPPMRGGINCLRGSCAPSRFASLPYSGRAAGLALPMGGLRRAPGLAGKSSRNSGN